MKILEVKLENIRAIEKLTWKLPDKCPAAGWHVILGDNGSGKSSFLRALAIGLLGLERSTALWVDYASWLRQNAEEGLISIKMQADTGDELSNANEGLIKVIGVGGGGSNAVNHMYNQGIKDVEFIICNTDAQALKSSSVPTRLAIGQNLTEGLGAGANPEKGRQAALESKEEIREMLSNDTKMVFITAGMGGGTGTGAAPVIAKVAKELGILTIGVVTIPFGFEGRKKKQAAEDGVRELSEICDTILVIPCDKLREMFGNITIREAFAKADNAIMTAVKPIIELVTITAEVNIEFEDVIDFLSNTGFAIAGSADTEGEGRALRAAQEALSSPLLNNTDIHGAQKILLSIMSGEQAELEMDELTEITEYIQDKAGHEAEVIFGHGIDSTLGHGIRVTLIATGFNPKFTTDTSVSLTLNDSDLIEPSQEENNNLSEHSGFDKLSESYSEEHLQHKKYLLKINFGFNSLLNTYWTKSTENGVDFSYKTAWGLNNGWFSAGFGPFRRFTGGDAEYEKLLDGPKNKKLAAHLSLFKENVALSEALSWLKELKFRSLESHTSGFLDLMKSFINQPDFLPHNTRLEEVSSEGIFFCDANHSKVNIFELSDGFRSVLSLAFELLRQLENNYGENIFEVIPDTEMIRVKVPGVVLIDEIDAHLHPVWQKRIGYWLTKHFPKIQFFVTTHSPLVCQASEKGSVFRLPVPGTDDLGGMVEGADLNRLIYGNVLEAYGTEVFGLAYTQSEAGQALATRLTALNEKALKAELTDAEKIERNDLRTILPISDSEAFVKKLLGDL
ncbi:cell division protein FtsZ [Pontibacter sp. BT213]|uniref:Cell division protein FtsZ n=2 Tax=Pontibacter fetidus TaxID=2700082 RepID=A0A6B2H9H3_9BACT|nr:cell division protein FtsZ [Pontibacter fetidus]